MLSKFVIKLAMNLGEGFNDISVIKIFKTSWRSTLKIKQFNLGLILILIQKFITMLAIQEHSRNNLHDKTIILFHEQFVTNFISLNCNNINQNHFNKARY